MARVAPWTYDLSPMAEDPHGIERFAVETADGERIGNVAAVLRRADEVFLAVELRYPPFRQETRAFPWPDVDAVDLQESAVRLTVTADALDERALVLDPDKKVEGEPAEAVRLSRLPGQAPTTVPAGTGGAPDRTVLLFVPFAAAIGAVVAIAAGAAAATGARWWLVPVAAVAFLVSCWGIVMSFRLYRDPTARRRRPRGRAAPPRA